MCMSGPKIQPPPPPPPAPKPLPPLQFSMYTSDADKKRATAGRKSLRIEVPSAPALDAPSGLNVPKG